MGVAFAPPPDEHPRLAIAAGAGAVVVLAVSLFASRIVLDLIVDFEWPIIVYVTLLGVIGYGPSLAWCWFAAGRWGTGTRSEVLGFTPRWSDLGWGPLVWFSAVLAQVAATFLVLGLDVPIANNTDEIGDLSADRTYTIAIVITAVVAAPIVEELVFRGLVLRSLLSVVPVPVALVVQGVLFGVAHVDPVRGVGNIGLAIVLSAVGVVFGVGAFLLRRVGPTMVAHAILNGIVMILLLTGIRDRILEENPNPFDESSVAAEQVAVVDQAHLAEPDRRGDPQRAT